MNNSRRIIWLDDIRNPFDPNIRWVSRTMNIRDLDEYLHIVWCKTFEEFVEEVQKSMPDAICFDHDLGDGKSGYDAAKWLVDYCLETGKLPPAFYCQSSNPAGRDNIMGLLNNFKAFIQDECKAN